MAPNHVAVVTGASSGLGWEFGRQLAEQGWRVGLIARRREKLEELATLIRSTGGNAAVAAADVADRIALEATITSLTAELGPVDLLIANAGIGRGTYIEPINKDEIEETIRINLFGVIHSINAVLPDMLQRGHGHLAAVSSLGGYAGLPGESAYCASKAAVITYMNGLRVQLRKRGIRVTTLCPGFVKTPMIAENQLYMPGLLDAPEAVRRMLRALRRGKKIYNFPWITTCLMRFAAWAPDWLLERLMGEYTVELKARKAAAAESRKPKG